MGLAFVADPEFHPPMNLILQFLGGHLLDLLQQGGNNDLGVVLLVAGVDRGSRWFGKDVDPHHIRVVDEDAPAAELARDAMGHRQTIVPQEMLGVL